MRWKSIVCHCGYMTEKVSIRPRSTFIFSGQRVLAAQDAERADPGLVERVCVRLRLGVVAGELVVLAHHVAVGVDALVRGRAVAAQLARQAGVVVGSGVGEQVVVDARSVSRGLTIWPLPIQAW